MLIPLSDPIHIYLNGTTIKNEGLLSYVYSHGLLHPYREDGCHLCANSYVGGTRSRTLRLLAKMPGITVQKSINVMIFTLTETHHIMLFFFISVANMAFIPLGIFSGADISWVSNH